MQPKWLPPNKLLGEKIGIKRRNCEAKLTKKATQTTAGQTNKKEEGIFKQQQSIQIGVKGRNSTQLNSDGFGSVLYLRCLASI